jgi:hypothetical protein
LPRRGRTVQSARPVAVPARFERRVRGRFRQGIAFERDRIGERIRATKRAQKARGEYLGGPTPFGYKYNEDCKLVPVPEQQRELRHIRKLAADGLAPRKISAALAARGEDRPHRVEISTLISSVVLSGIPFESCSTPSYSLASSTSLFCVS